MVTAAVNYEPNTIAQGTLVDPRLPACVRQLEARWEGYRKKLKSGSRVPGCSELQ